jgi:hypothetical protein
MIFRAGILNQSKPLVFIVNLEGRFKVQFFIGIRYRREKCRTSALNVPVEEIPNQSMANFVPQASHQHQRFRLDNA